MDGDDYHSTNQQCFDGAYLRHTAWGRYAFLCLCRLRH